MSCRRTAVTIVIAACIVFCLAGAAFAEPPPDVRGHWAERQVAEWVDKGFAVGYPDGTFRPENSITRVEFIILANRSFGFTETAAIDFSDVSPTDWFYKEVCRAVAAGYIFGYEDGTVRPSRKISRQEAAAMLFRLLGLQDTGGLGAAGNFKDAGSIPSWSVKFIGVVAAGGYMNGYPDGTFRPERPITRAEAVAVLDRATAAAKTAAGGGAGTYGGGEGAEAVGGDADLAEGASVTAGGEEISEPAAGAGAGGMAGGGGGGGSIDTTPPRVTAATITVGGVERSIEIDSGGLSGRIDLRDLDPSAQVTAGSITVTEAAKLRLTMFGLEQDLEAGCNRLGAVDLFSALLGQEATLGALKALLGNPVDLGGELTDGSGNTSSVSLLVTLP